jgi:hypothetical protein
VRRGGLRRLRHRAHGRRRRGLTGAAAGTVEAGAGRGRCRLGVRLAPRLDPAHRGGRTGVEAGGDDGDPHLVTEGVVDDRTEDDVGLGVRGVGDQLRRLVDLEQAEVAATGDVEQHAVSAVHAGLEQRAGDGHLGGDRGAVLARALPMPISALPAPVMTALTSAKSRLIRPGVVIRSVMPWTPESSTWSALLKASMTLTVRSLIDSSRSFGMMMSVSTSARSAAMPSSACWRAAALEGERPGDDADRQAPERRATLATTGAPPVPVPPPSPAVTKTMSAPLSTSSISSRWSSAACRPTSGQRPRRGPGSAPADVELDVGVAHQQGLRVGVDRDELDALEARPRSCG